jgi:hypothetical protein
VSAVSFLWKKLGYSASVFSILFGKKYAGNERFLVYYILHDSHCLILLRRIYPMEYDLLFHLGASTNSPKYEGFIHEVYMHVFFNKLDIKL